MFLRWTYVPEPVWRLEERLGWKLIVTHDHTDTTPVFPHSQAQFPVGYEHDMLLSVAAIAALVTCQVVGTEVQTPALEKARLAVVNANNAFSTSLYQALSSEPGNLVMSPLSVETVLAMTWLGAGGNSASQLTAGLHLPQSRHEVEAGFSRLLSSLQDRENITLDIANKIFLQQGFIVKDTFRQSAVKNFHSDVQEVDFTNDKEAARSTINQWVEEKTHNKIKDLIAEGTLDTDTALILTNAIYFKGDWLNPFNETHTSIAPFHLASGASVNVSMMFQISKFYYRRVSKLNAEALLLPYSGESLSMLVLLPKKIDGLRQLETSLATLNVTELVTDLNRRHVHVSLPKFKIETKLELKDALKQLGIIDIFQEDAANLTGITDKNVHVSKVVQKAFVEVTEKGTVAAAATQVTIHNRMARRKYDFKVDHPFLFLILDNRSGTILFLGRVEEPSS